MDKNAEALEICVCLRALFHHQRSKSFLTHVCGNLDQSCCLRSNQVIHYKLIRGIKWVYFHSLSETVQKWNEAEKVRIKHVWKKWHMQKVLRRARRKELMGRFCSLTALFLGTVYEYLGAPLPEQSRTPLPSRFLYQNPKSDLLNIKTTQRGKSS